MSNFDTFKEISRYDLSPLVSILIHEVSTPRGVLKGYIFNKEFLCLDGERRRGKGFLIPEDVFVDWLATSIPYLLLRAAVDRAYTLREEDEAIGTDEDEIPDLGTPDLPPWEPEE